MFSIATVSTILAAASFVAAVPAAHTEAARSLTERSKPAGWPDALLENYDTYHARYTALNCSTKHGDKAFFNQCCTPMLAGQSLSSRPAKCNPTAAPTSNASTSTDPSSPDDCVDEPASTPAAPSSHTLIASGGAGQKHKGKKHHKGKGHKGAPAPRPKKKGGKKHNGANGGAVGNVGGGAVHSSGGEVFTGGKATFFFQGGQAGACGQPHDDSFPLVALDHRRYGPDSRASPDCGRHVLVTNVKNGKSVTAMVADDCPTCSNANSLDMSVGAFTQIGTKEEGELDIAWKFID